MCKVTSGVAWRPISHMCVHVSDLWRGMVSRKSLTSVFELKNWMLRQPDQNNKGCLSIQFLLRTFCNLRLVDVKYCRLKDFLKAQFVNFMCQKYVKNGYMEMGEQVYLDSNVKYCDLKDFFKGSICNF